MGRHVSGHTEKFIKSCPECAVTVGAGPLHLIPVNSTTSRGKHVIVFQDYLTKWPMVYPLHDQKTHRIARILVDKIIPFYDVSCLTEGPTSYHTICEICVRCWA